MSGTASAVAAAPVAAPAPAPAPSSAPAAAPAPSAPSFGGRGSNPSSTVDPSKFPIREDYAAALLTEKLGAIGSEPAPAAVAVAQPAETSAEVAQPVAADAATATPAAAPAEAERLITDFSLDDPPGLVTPESMGRLAQEHPEFARVLESTPALREQLLATAREAALTQQYRELLPDVEAARAAVAAHRTWNSMLSTFEGSGTREGTMETLRQMAELSYERGDDGKPLMRDGKPVIGEDFFGFVDNVVALDLDARIERVTARLARNRYSGDEARWKDETLAAALKALKVLRGSDEGDESAVAGRERNLDKRERDLEKQRRAREQEAKIAPRRQYEREIVTAAQDLVTREIRGLIEGEVKRGAVISEFVMDSLIGKIGAELVGKIKGSSYQSAMEDLQRLPATAAARQQRLDTVRRAVKHYLPTIARAQMRAAGVRGGAASAEGQSEPGSGLRPGGAPAAAGGPVTAEVAYAKAEAEWKAKHPGKVFDKAARDMILPRVVELVSGRS